MLLVTHEINETNGRIVRQSVAPALDPLKASKPNIQTKPDTACRPSVRVRTASVDIKLRTEG